MEKKYSLNHPNKQKKSP